MPKFVPKPSREQTARVNKSRPKTRKLTGDQHTITPPAVGSSIPLDDNFGGDIFTQDGRTTSIKNLLVNSPKGLIVFIYPKALDDNAYDLYVEFDYHQFNWERANMSTIGISPDSVSATAAFVKEKDIRLPLLSDPSMSLIKAMGFVPAEGRVQQSAFILSKDRVLLARTTGKVEKIIDDLNRVLDGIMEEMEYESPE
ncbi:hypothetical protein CNMCM6936_004289 [Aspergillus lentulus]|uniref:Peroxiredoxin C1773.02c n=1 Tax=Aspergillus lentulus TaxID=293939 RepID=A0AAN6BJM5_ASPLE|nr:hypothetical protein CNMCM6936_004289 [Aspergillus lentulus]KAF4170866.1 hypothetical protein CNMCM8060_004100 [Aspergillus lentulus]KAF4191089.1 hypothetical protein CNMCM8694_002386 [Aspergillus lentulus]KAF4200129.1 hypothetical protein CNMCM8927_003952 [Aspergillus lentulus]GFF78952.1 peroxiredoxin C1773.02c [Aspergillus lentulus]